MTALVGFVLRLIPPRPTFIADMNEQERSTMAAHIAYWSALAESGQVIAFGPVADPNGPYGIGIIVAEDQAHAQRLCDADPALGGGHGLRTELAPMPRLVTPAGTYDGGGRGGPPPSPALGG